MCPSVGISSRSGPADVQEKHRLFTPSTIALNLLRAKVHDPLVCHYKKISQNRYRRQFCRATMCAFDDTGDDGGVPLLYPRQRLIILAWLYASKRA